MRVFGIHLARFEAVIDDLIAVAPQFGLELALVHRTGPPTTVLQKEYGRLSPAGPAINSGAGQAFISHTGMAAPSSMAALKRSAQLGRAYFCHAAANGTGWARCRCPDVTATGSPD